MLILYMVFCIACMIMYKLMKKKQVKGYEFFLYAAMGITVVYIVYISFSGALEWKSSSMSSIGIVGGFFSGVIFSVLSVLINKNGNKLLSRVLYVVAFICIVIGLLFKEGVL